MKDTISKICDLATIMLCTDEGKAYLQAFSAQWKVALDCNALESEAEVLALIESREADAIGKLFEDFWFFLPDVPAVRMPGFLTVCELTESWLMEM